MTVFEYPKLQDWSPGDMDKAIAKLVEPFPAEHKIKHETTDRKGETLEFTFVGTHLYRARLNRIFGPGNWSWEVLHTSSAHEERWACFAVSGRLTLGYGEMARSQTALGSCTCFLKNGRPDVAWAGAETQAFTRACRNFGMLWDADASDDIIEKGDTAYVQDAHPGGDDLFRSPAPPQHSSPQKSDVAHSYSTSKGTGDHVYEFNMSQSDTQLARTLNYKVFSDGLRRVYEPGVKPPSAGKVLKHLIDNGIITAERNPKAPNDTDITILDRDYVCRILPPYAKDRPSQPGDLTAWVKFILKVAKSGADPQELPPKPDDDLPF